MPFPLTRPSRLLFATGMVFATCASAQTGPDFGGIWQLNDKESDSAAIIAERLHAEKKREQAPSSRPASASSSGAPVASSNSGFGGRGGGRGMGSMGGGGGMGGMGGGHMGGGRRGNHDSQDSSSGNNSTPQKDPTPPLLTHDSFLNVQQHSQDLRVDFNNTNRLETRFDGVERQSLNSNARVQTRLSPDGMDVSMTFDDGTQLNQSWVRSSDGHHLVVTETWKPRDLKEPITFKRSYDRLDL